MYPVWPSTYGVRGENGVGLQNFGAPKCKCRYVIGLHNLLTHCRVKERSHTALELAEEGPVYSTEHLGQFGVSIEGTPDLSREDRASLPSGQYGTQNRRDIPTAICLQDHRNFLTEKVTSRRRTVQSPMECPDAVTVPRLQEI